MAMYNCSQMEEMFQALSQDKGSGTHRCWEKAGDGQKYESVVGTEEQPRMVYLTSSCTVQGSAKDGTLILGDRETTGDYDTAHGRPWVRPSTCVLVWFVGVPFM
jgi:hypothetical protein